MVSIIILVGFLLVNFILCDNRNYILSATNEWRNICTNRINNRYVALY